MQINIIGNNSNTIKKDMERLDKCFECKSTAIEFICSACKWLVCDKCTSKHPAPLHHLHLPENYLYGILSVKRVVLSEYFEALTKAGQSKYILERLLKELNKVENGKEIAKSVNTKISTLQRFMNEANNIMEKVEEIGEKLKREKVDYPMKLLQELNAIETDFKVPDTSTENEEQMVNQAAQKVKQRQNPLKTIKELTGKVLSEWVDTQKEDINSAEIRLQDLAKQENEARQKLDQLNKEASVQINKIKKDHENYEKSLKDEIASQKETQEILKKDISALNKDKRQLEKDIEIITKELSSKDDLKADLENSKKELSNINNQIGKAEEKLDSTIGKIRRERLNLETLVKENREKEAIIKDLNEEIEDKNAKHEKLKNKVKEQNQRLEKIDANIAEKEEKSAKLDTKLGYLREDIADLKKEKERLEPDYIKYRACSKEVFELESLRNRRMHEVEELNSQRLNLSQKIMLMQYDLERLAEEKKRKENACAMVTAELRETQNEMDSVKDELQRTKDQIKDLIGDKTSTKLYKEAMNREVLHFKESVMKALKQIKSLYQEFRANLDVVKVRKETFSKDINAAINAMKPRVKKAISEYKSQKGVYNQIVNEKLAEYKIEINGLKMSLEQVCSELKDQINCGNGFIEKVRSINCSIKEDSSKRKKEKINITNILKAFDTSINKGIGNVQDKCILGLKRLEGARQAVEKLKADYEKIKAENSELHKKKNEDKEISGEFEIVQKEEAMNELPKNTTALKEPSLKQGQLLEKLRKLANKVKELREENNTVKMYVGEIFYDFDTLLNKHKIDKALETVRKFRVDNKDTVRKKEDVNNEIIKLTKEKEENAKLIKSLQKALIYKEEDLNKVLPLLKERMETLNECVGSQKLKITNLMERYTQLQKSLKEEETALDKHTKVADKVTKLKVKPGVANLLHKQVPKNEGEAPKPVIKAKDKESTQLVEMIAEKEHDLGQELEVREQEKMKKHAKDEQATFLKKQDELKDKVSTLKATVDTLGIKIQNLMGAYTNLRNLLEKERDSIQATMTKIKSLSTEETKVPTQTTMKVCEEDKTAANTPKAKNTHEMTGPSLGTYIKLNCCKKYSNKEALRKMILDNTIIIKSKNRFLLFTLTIELTTVNSPVCNCSLSKETIRKCLSEEEFKKKCLEICCHCHKKFSDKYKPCKSMCGYHKACEDCQGKKGSSCNICQIFEFTPLSTSCCYCNKVVDLPKTDALDCTHRICKICSKNFKEYKCNLCDSMRKMLLVTMAICNLQQICKCRDRKVSKEHLICFVNGKPSTKVFGFACSTCRNVISHLELVREDYNIEDKIRQVLENSKTIDDYYVSGIYNQKKQPVPHTQSHYQPIII
eukprot:TRINITY_DN122659_c0_g1_i1.p1 TRINITY_DN122659_c0_g1~~TRINITY_DN122659_c0_g1_i1.p1  ORF type:complete len:1355 (+),score=253.51 TRINITY_DN122659_c0_g1_i1:76-4140(+)